MRAFLDDPIVAGSGTPRDVCVLLHWHHRAAWLRREGCAERVLPYELMYTDTAEYSRELSRLLGLPPAAAAGAPTAGRSGRPRGGNRNCLSVRKRGAWPGAERPPLPNYLASYDAPTVRRVAAGIERYLNLSDDFRSPTLPACDHRARWWPPMEPWMVR